MRTSAGKSWVGIPFILGGISLALFILLHPYDALAGAHGARMATWVPAHTLHFLGALFTLFGLVQLREAWLEALGRAGRAGYYLSFIGMAMFVGTGMITAFLWPAIAEHDPGFVAATGPMFTDRLAVGSIQATYGFMVAGFLALAFGVQRARLLTLVDAVLVGLGVLMFSAPVEPIGPAPWILRVAGGIVFGAGLVRMGFILRSAPASSESIETRHSVATP